MGRSMNFTGEHGGMIAAAFVGAWAMATAFWFGIAGVIWKLFFNPRIKSLEDQLENERRECARQHEMLTDRIKQLETMLLMHGPQALRQAMQISLSEHSLALDAVKGKGE